MHSYLVGLDNQNLVWDFIYIPTLWVQAVKALAWLQIYAVLPEPSLFAYAISTRFNVFDKIY